jgi:hypothetical protein
MVSGHLGLVGLRSQSRVLLEVSMSDIKNYKLSDITIETVADLFYLSEVQSFPPHLQRALRVFVEKLGRELADGSDTSILGTVRALGLLAPAQISTTFRDALADECVAGRTSSTTEQITNFLSGIADDAPSSPLERPTKSVEVTKAPASRNTVVAGRAFASGKDGGGLAQAGGAGSKPKRAAAAGVPHLAWTEKAVIKSLRQFGRQGVSGMVVSAVVQKQATNEGLTGVSMASIKVVLNSLTKAKRISTSSGRWFAL